MNLILEQLRKKIQQHLRESVNAPLYVEYLKDMSNEIPFELGGKRWQFVWAKYPNGKRDIGVYAFGEDLVYNYESWRKMMGIDKGGENIGASNYDRHFRSDTKNTNEETEVGTKGDVELAKLINYKPYAFILDKVREDFGIDSDIYESLMDVFAYDKFDYNQMISVLKNFDVYERYKHMLGLNEEIVDDENNVDDYYTSDETTDLNYTDDVESEEKPDYDNDAFIQDVVSGGYDVSVSGKHLGHYEEMETALLNLKNEFNRSNYFPTIWFVSDHGNYWPIDEKGNEIKQSLNENYERNKAIAETIIQQIGGFGKLKMMTGAYNFVAIDNGVQFKIKNPKANCIKIVLNGKDLYDVEIGRLRGADYKVLVDEKDVYAENLKELIEKSTGMYLSLFESKVTIKSLLENSFFGQNEEDQLKQYAKYLMDIYQKANNHYMEASIYLQLLQFYEEGQIKDLFSRSTKTESKIKFLNYLRKDVQMFLDVEETGVITKTFEEFINDWK